MHDHLSCPSKQVMAIPNIGRLMSWELGRPTETFFAWKTLQQAKNVYSSEGNQLSSTICWASNASMLVIKGQTDNVVPKR